MKIAILIPTIKAGGAEKQAVLLAVSLADEHEVHFVAFYGHSNESLLLKQTLENGNVKIHYLEGGFWNKCKTYYRFLMEEKIEAAFNYLTICDVVGCYIERKAGVNTIFNGIRNSRLAPLKMFTERITHNHVADFTVFNCYSGAEYFGNKGYKKSKILVIPNCFPNISEPIKHKNDGVKTIITVARFEKQKDYETTIRAIAELRKMRQDFQFTIIGHGMLEQEIRNWVKKYGIEEFTTFHIAPNNVQELLKAADIYLSTSLFEGTSNSIMEAMNWSIPVVATSVGDNYKLIEKEWNGFLSAIGDYTSMAKQMEKLLADDNLRIEMGLRGNERLNNYSVQKFNENYKKILKQS